MKQLSRQNAGGYRLRGAHPVFVVAEHGVGRCRNPGNKGLDPNTNLRRPTVDVRNPLAVRSRKHPLSRCYHCAHLRVDCRWLAHSEMQTSGRIPKCKRLKTDFSTHAISQDESEG